MESSNSQPRRRIDLKKIYGEEYPVAVLSDGVRLPLEYETLFSRYYTKGNTGVVISRFMDGSATMTANELQRDWANWTEDQKVDFCQASCWLNQQEDFPEILRLIIAHGCPKVWSAIAGLAATCLPQEEAYRFLVGALQTMMDNGICSNLIQGIAITKHPEADAVIRRHLQGVWENPKLWDDDSFLNWVASEAEKSIEYLLELGAGPKEFEEQVARLSKHVCSGNRESVRRWLSKYYSWLK